MTATGNAQTMTDHSATFKIRIESPIGENSIEQFRHWLNKVADESENRFGISITIERVDE